MVGRFIGRLILVPLGLLLAALAAFGVLATLGLERLTHAISADGPASRSLDEIFEFLRLAMLLLSSLTLLPALAVVIVGEAARVRSLLYYVVGGGLALIAIPILARLGQGGGQVLPAAAVWPVFATAGFAGGLVYWLVAGRRA
jgi:hypothetical protein